MTEGCMLRGPASQELGRTYEGTIAVHVMCLTWLQGLAYMVEMGATLSTLAMSTPTSARQTVSSSAKVGSPLKPGRPK